MAKSSEEARRVQAFPDVRAFADAVGMKEGCESRDKQLSRRIG